MLPNAAACCFKGPCAVPVTLKKFDGNLMALGPLLEVKIHNFLPRVETRGIIEARDSAPVTETKSVKQSKKIDLNLLHLYNCCEFWAEYHLQMY